MQPETIKNRIRPGNSQEVSSLVETAPAELDIEKELDVLRRSSEWHSGLARKVLVRYPNFHITLRAMKAGACIPEHQNPGRISVQTVHGHIRMHAGGKLFELPKGKVLVLDRAVRHDVEAVEESAFLLTVALPERSAS